MKYLNIGCGNHYSNKMEWINIDFISHGKNVIKHNLLRGVPFKDDTFDLVYHSHVLEHFSKEDGIHLIEECYRVLKPGGILRIAIPDLEQIARIYLNCLEKSFQNPIDKIAAANYEWMLLEMFDQTVRNQSGGRMGFFLTQETIINEDFVFERIGDEGRAFRNNTSLSPIKRFSISNIDNTVIKIKIYILKKVRRIKNMLLFIIGVDFKAYRIGRFRLGGEIHQWMYDRYSLMNLLTLSGFKNIQIKDAFTSDIDNWVDYCLDGKDSNVRKPDSLFIEAVK